MGHPNRAQGRVEMYLPHPPAHAVAAEAIGPTLAVTGGGASPSLCRRSYMDAQLHAQPAKCIMRSSSSSRAGGGAPAGRRMQAAAWGLRAQVKGLPHWPDALTCRLIKSCRVHSQKLKLGSLLLRHTSDMRGRCQLVAPVHMRYWHGMSNYIPSGGRPQVRVSRADF